MDGVFITAPSGDGAAAASSSSSVLARRPHLRQAVDACFCQLLALFLVAVYFTLMSHTIFRHTNDFAGNSDFYVAATRRTFAAKP